MKSPFYQGSITQQIERLIIILWRKQRSINSISRELNIPKSTTINAIRQFYNIVRIK